MNVKVQVIFYSMFGHIHKMAVAVAEGVDQVDGAIPELYQVAELVPEAALERTGAKALRQAFAGVPLADPSRLPEADAVIFGTPTRFGMMCAQMRNFLDQTGAIWASGGLIGKVGSVFTSTATQHGGQETTLVSFHTTLLHHGMIVVGVPFSNPLLSAQGEMTGGTPYGASTIAGADGSRQPTSAELDLARIQGRRVAEIALALKRGQA
ncbi:MAG: NAD(P)H:quinone oxidoreductase [Desulfarculus sp.]|nr:NAD(P)H:quinone oxidoreductase [Desulfarculus sp.]